MAENSKIAWCDHTMNFWLGCQKVSPACDHCYAESWANRFGQPELWTGQRRRTKPANWRKLVAWNDCAAAYARRQRVFCSSLSDFFDNQVPDEWRADAWDMIRKLRNLDFLVLTKRPQNIRKMLPLDWGEGWPHVWLGTTVENQQEADRRIPHLLAVPTAVRFLSCEPLLQLPELSAIDISGHEEVLPLGAGWLGRLEPGEREHPRIDWVIVGGESGPGARSMNIDWARDLRKQCASAGVAFFMKQLGGERDKRDRMEDFPEDLRVREFPAAATAAKVSSAS